MASLIGTDGEGITPTVTPLIHGDGLLTSVVVASNVSSNGTPVRFILNLARPAVIHLALFSLAGEQVYQTQAQGAAGLNNVLWNLQNSASETVSSGLYVYFISLNDGETHAQAMGKVVILH
jgi:hypothetical protein